MNGMMTFSTKRTNADFSWYFHFYALFIIHMNIIPEGGIQ